MTNKKQKKDESRLYFEKLGVRESSNNYKKVNSSGFLGKYQMGEAALIDTGNYKKKTGDNNDWSGQFTGKNGVYSKADFLNNPQAQDKAVRDYSEIMWKYIKNKATKYDGEIINGIPVTQSGMIAGAHLVGPGRELEYLDSNGKIIPKDGNGTSVEDYMENMGGYDVTSITKTPPNPSKYDILNTLLNPFYKSSRHSALETGFAAPIDESTFTPEQIGAMSNEEFAQREGEIFRQMQQGIIQPSTQVQDFSGYTNPLTGNGQIFTREDIDSMSNEEFAKNEDAIMAQIKQIGAPTNKDMKNAANLGGAVYVHPYTRSDGTQVKGYYRAK